MVYLGFGGCAHKRHWKAEASVPRSDPRTGLAGHWNSANRKHALGSRLPSGAKRRREPATVPADRKGLADFPGYFYERNPRGANDGADGGGETGERT